LIAPLLAIIQFSCLEKRRDKRRAADENIMNTTNKLFSVDFLIELVRCNYPAVQFSVRHVHQLRVAPVQEMRDKRNVLLGVVYSPDIATNRAS